MAVLALPMRSKPHMHETGQFFDNDTILVFITSRSKANLTTSISQNTLTCVYKCLTLKQFKS